MVLEASLPFLLPFTKNQTEMIVSVIVPAFNRPQQLLQAVRSVLSQTVSEYELIVVDDGSVEDVSEAEQVVLERDHMFIHAPHRGVAHARNLGVKQASREWLAFLDSDDRWLPNKLEQQLEYHRLHPEIVISHCEEIWYRHGVRVNQKLRHKMAAGDAFFRSLELCCISPSSVMLRREVFDEAQGFDERMIVCEDYDFWLRVTVEHEIGLVPGSLVEKFGGHSDQLSKSQPAMDRFRVFALAKLLLEQDLRPEQTLEAAKVLQHKSRILALGAGKRGNTAYQELYNKVSLVAGAMGTEEKPCSKKAELQLYFQALLANINGDDTTSEYSTP